MNKLSIDLALEHEKQKETNKKRYEIFSKKI